jgi:hypothetical protein
MRHHVVSLAAKPAELTSEVHRLRHALSVRDAELHAMRLQLRDNHRGPSQNITDYGMVHFVSTFIRCVSFN